MHSGGSLRECKYSFNAWIWNTSAANHFNGCVEEMNCITVLVQYVELDWSSRLGVGREANNPTP
jgi:hypothetical protein